LLAFLIENEAESHYDSLLDELLATVIPNLERFPMMLTIYFQLNISANSNLTCIPIAHLIDSDPDYF